jgi:hypothetical protein
MRFCQLPEGLVVGGGGGERASIDTSNSFFFFAFVDPDVLRIVSILGIENKM